MKQTTIGTYPIGPMQAQLVLREGIGGEFWTCPEKGAVCRIKVGSAGDWNRTVAILLHEATEFCYMQAGLRWGLTPDYSSDNGNYMFVMTHTQFSEATARAAEFVAQALPDLAKVYNRWKKKPTK